MLTALGVRHSRDGNALPNAKQHFMWVMHFCSIAFESVLNYILTKIPASLFLSNYFFNNVYDANS